MGLVSEQIRRRWPGNCMVYAISSALSDIELTRISEAMNEWREKSSVRFVKRTTQARYVRFIPDEVPFDRICSSSDIGMAGGEQLIRIDPTVSTGVLVHEIGHALGYYHEHKRRDRGPFINVHTSEIQPKYRYQFERVDAGEASNLTTYDLRSIMHYGEARIMSLDGSTPLITTDDPADQNLIGQQALSALDIEAAISLDAPNHHVYQLTHNGEIEVVVEHDSWTSGWKVSRAFTVGATKYMLLLKPSSGAMHLHRINLDGSIGDRVQTRDWTSGWNQAVKYAVLGSDYLMLYKRNTGDVHIHKLAGDGQVAERIVDGQIEDKWTDAAFYAIGSMSFMMFSDSSTGRLRVYEISWDGKLAQPKHFKKFSPGWSVVRPYRVLSNNYLLMLNTASGSVKIRKLEADGSVGTVVQSRNWSSGWTESIPYHTGPDTFVLSLKKGTGDLSIRRVEIDGRIGSETDRRIIGAGFDNIAIYGVGVGTYIQLIRY